MADTFLLISDGRCGFQRPDGRVHQLCPRPIPSFSLRDNIKKKKRGSMREKWAPKFICKKLSAGSRHSLFLMIDCSADDEDAADRTTQDGDEGEFYDDTKVVRKRKRPRKVLSCGLNQVGLCEEPGENEPTPIYWESTWDRPADITAGRGTSFVLTKSGHVYSWGNNRYGMLGLQHFDATLQPQRVEGLLMRRVVRQVAAGGFHVICRTDDDEIYAWGRNNKGQLGIGEEGDDVTTPTLVQFQSNARRMRVVQVCAGQEHSIALMEKTNRTRRSQTWSQAVPLAGTLISNTMSTAGSSRLSIAASRKEATQASSDKEKAQRRGSSAVDVDEQFDVEVLRYVFAWGDESRGQLGSGDKELRYRPQENYWLTKLTQSLQIRIGQIAAGGFHNLALVEGSGQVISWGAGDKGQLGHGLQFDNSKPQLINQLERAITIAAGLRHSAAVCDNGATSEVFMWGCNGWGQLGLGDTDVRLQPTKISAIKSSRVVQVSCGERHTLLLLNHHPMRAQDIPALQPFFEVLAAQEGQVQKRSMLRALQHQLKVQLPALDPALLEAPEQLLKDQAGLTADELRNDVFEKGLQYCLDTKCDEFDWRRKSLEACFEVRVPPGRLLKKVCLACARNCLHMYRLRPYIRSRQRGDTCDCRMSGLCVSLWSPVREAFDTMSVDSLADDGCISPRQVRSLLKRLRAPFPVESADVEEALGVLAQGVETADLPRIGAVAFEAWYRRHYDEHGDDDPQQQIQRVLAEQKRLAEEQAQLQLEEELRRRKEDDKAKEKELRRRARGLRALTGLS